MRRLKQNMDKIRNFGVSGVISLFGAILGGILFWVKVPWIVFGILQFVVGCVIALLLRSVQRWRLLTVLVQGIGCGIGNFLLFFYLILQISQVELNKFIDEHSLILIASAVGVIIGVLTIIFFPAYGKKDKVVRTAIPSTQFEPIPEALGNTLLIPNYICPLCRRNSGSDGQSLDLRKCPNCDTILCIDCWGVPNRWRCLNPECKINLRSYKKTKS
ncbi:MAG: hypothetical protein AB1422_00270 [bacterium]